jgi:hypothetical protein
MILGCDSARINPVHDTIARDWNNETGLSSQQATNNGLLEGDRALRGSTGLEGYHDYDYDRWIWQGLKLIGIRSPKGALDIVHLVCNVR